MDFFPASEEFSDVTVSMERLTVEEVKSLSVYEGHWEPCKKCNGTGVWTSWSGRTSNTCFACKGKKGRSYKTSSETRAKARAASAEKARVEAKALLAFTETHQDVAAWIRQNSERNDFARSLNEQLGKRGSLSENQVAAVRRNIVKVAERQAERAAAAPTADTTGIEELFAAAAANGKKRLKLFLGDYRISPAPATGRNAGALYVKKDGEYLGKISGGKVFCGAATADVAKEVNGIRSLEDLKVRGQQTGICCVCGAELTDPNSIAAGIGPYCAAGF